MKAPSRYPCCARRAPAGRRGGGGRVTVAAAAVCLALAASGGPAPAAERPPLSDGPVIWYAGDDRPIPVPAEWDPELIVTEMDASVSTPVARGLNPVRWISGAGPAANVNALDEAPDSAWFTNRMGLRPLTAAELAAGPGAAGPDTTGPWLIVGAKTDGVTAGFRIRDGAGATWLLKFDPPHHPGQSIRAGVVSNLLLHACGYNVPVDRLAVFDRRRLRVGEGAGLRPLRGLGGDVQLTEANLDSVLAATGSVFDGRYQALASRYLDGIPLGPIAHDGVRRDDPNDTVPHEQRREWRALRVFCAWIGHVDMKVQNSLDMYVGEPGRGYVRHYLLDFATTLGTSGAEPYAKFGYEYGVDIGRTLERMASLGRHHDAWQEIAWPEHLAEVGDFSAERFDPLAWRPISPHAAMRDLDDRDGYWAAKIVSAFTDEDLRVVVAQGGYRDAAAVDYLVEHLGRRRDIIARTWFDRVPPLDFFAAGGDSLAGRDLGVERGVYEAAGTSYLWRARPVRADRSSDVAWSAPAATPSPACPVDAVAAPDDHRFLAVEWRVDRGAGPSGPVTVYLAADRRVVAVDR